MNDQTQTKKRRARRIAVLAGLLLGLSCYCVPPEYQDVCAMAAKIFGAVCGGA